MPRRHILTERQRQEAPCARLASSWRPRVPQVIEAQRLSLRSSLRYAHTRVAELHAVDSTGLAYVSRPFLSHARSDTEPMPMPTQIRWRIACPSCEQAPLLILKSELFTRTTDEGMIPISGTRDGFESVRQEYDQVSPSEWGTGVRITMVCCACQSEIEMDVAEDLEDEQKSGHRGSLFTQLRSTG